MFTDELKHREVALGIPYHPGVILQVQEADVAMMVLQGFQLESRAVFRLKLESFVAAIVGGDVFVEPGAVVFQEAITAEGPLAIWPPLRVHLKQAQIQPKLDLLAPVLRFELTGDHLAGLIFPAAQEIRYVEIHRPNMAVAHRQVNASTEEIQNL